jgi:hypothetical protein
MDFFGALGFVPGAMASRIPWVCSFCDRLRSPGSRRNSRSSTRAKARLPLSTLHIPVGTHELQWSYNKPDPTWISALRRRYTLLTGISGNGGCLSGVGDRRRQSTLETGITVLEQGVPAFDHWAKSPTLKELGAKLGTPSLNQIYAVTRHVALYFADVSGRRAKKFLRVAPTPQHSDQK